MSSKKYRKIAGALITLAGEITDNKKLKKSILGTYSDGSTRSVVDAVTGEYLSSSSKEKIKKKKKKNKKHYNKYMKALGYETKYSKGKKKKKGKKAKIKKEVYGKGKNRVIHYTF